MTKHNVLVVGGGIAGLTAAIALRKAGVAVEVLEINAGWVTGGWGLSLTGPALRALDSLGIADTCISEGFGITAIRNYDQTGNLLNVIELPPLLGPGRPAQAGLARPTLLKILREGAIAAGADLRNGTTVTGIDDDGTTVTATLSDGTTKTVDLLIAADGVHSRTRSLLGVDVEPRYTHQMVWRALVDRPEWATALSTFAGDALNAGVIPISPESAYLFLTTQHETISDPHPDEVLAEELRELLAGFEGPIATIRDTIVDSSKVVRRPVHVLMLDTMQVGRAAIIGDAAHSPSPQMVSGAAIAIEDGVVLAEELARTDDVQSALQGFDRRRVPRARALVEASVRIGELEQLGHYEEVHSIQQNAHRAMTGAI